MREHDWRQLYISGVTPEDAADRAAGASGEAKWPFGGHTLSFTKNGGYQRAT
jgi:hypothetical protein